MPPRPWGDTMAEAGPGTAGSYVAFISYSHKDAAVGRWLHRKLEGYRLPKRLAGTQGDDGEVPARLTPIFRDRDELPAAGDLSERVRAALAASRSLMVVCSPNSAVSPWVAKEIATFRALHPDRPVFTAIVEGEPDQCFAPALLEGGAEPLAADLRKEGDGRRLGLLKLVAGLAGVGLDALVQRDAQKRIRRVTYVTSAAVAAMLAMALLTAFALNARAEAERQRTEAEGLVEFMLTDLRTKLKGVGRLDALRIANERAWRFYQRQEVGRLGPASMGQRARILHAMGEDYLNSGDVALALRTLQAAERTTSKLLADDPRAPESLYLQAQSEFWLGNVDYKRKKFAQARRAFERYKALAERLVSVDPANPRSRTELAYAEGNLCSMDLAPPVDAVAALHSCAKSLAEMQRVAKHSGDPQTIGDVSNRYGWLADAYRAAGNLDRAWSNRLAAERLLVRLVAADPKNMDFRDRWLTNQFMMAELETDRNQRAAARRRLLRARGYAREMTRLDLANYEWRRWQDRIEQDLIRLSRKGS
jgi:tetratricopeptide (TPR) repeat protein